MFTANQLCEKIVSIYPEIGTCGIDISVKKNDVKDTWLVHLKSDAHELDHFLESIDAHRCMEGKECVALGLDIAQLKKNIKRKQF